jgi:hypothetical protein
VPFAQGGLGRLRELEAENAALECAMAVLTTDKLILKEVVGKMVEEALGNILLEDE